MSWGHLSDVLGRFDREHAGYCGERHLGGGFGLYAVEGEQTPTVPSSASRGLVMKRPTNPISKERVGRLWAEKSQCHV